MTFGGIAGARPGSVPAWDRTTATCSSTYCHGATLAGGTNTAPLWTGGPSQATCGSCHGVPPPAPHPASDLTGCVACHPETMDAGGALIPPSLGGKHVDGIVEAAGAHDAAWMDQASAGFHAYPANANLQSCTACHGATLAGGSGPACSSCHDGVTANAWGGCTMWHGGTANQTGAPPRATWGNGSAVAVGAHSSHVGTNPVSGPIACAECHATPADALPRVTLAGRFGDTSVVFFRASSQIVFFAGDVAQANLVELADAVAGPLSRGLDGT